MSTSEDADLTTLHDQLRGIKYFTAVEGKSLCEGIAPLVVESTTAAGRVLAVKVSERGNIDKSEADMMQYAATHGIRAPKVLGWYEIHSHRPTRPVGVALVSDKVPGVPLVDVWLDLSKETQSSITTQLRGELQRMRNCTQPYIGCIHRQPTRNVYDRLFIHYCGPFESEQEFDEWCLARVNRGSLSRWRWNKFLERERRKSGNQEFVLTHGDLSPRNIMVQDGVVTGIIDWERSGFFPRYAEYAFAMKLCHSHERWWIPVLKDLLEPCSKDRLEFTRLVEDRGW